MVARRLGSHQPAAVGDLGDIQVTVISNMPLRRFESGPLSTVWFESGVLHKTRGH